MAQVDFSQFLYYPALQCSPEEHRGYRELADGDKEAIVPTFELSQRADEGDLNSGIAAIRESCPERPFILDLCKDPAPPPFVSQNKPAVGAEEQRIERQREAQESYNRILARLLDPADGFAGWREMTAQFPNCIPTIQFTDPDTQGKNILRQGALLSRDSECISIRVPYDASEKAYSLVAQVISILPSADNLLILMDCGYGRQRMAERAAFAHQAIKHIMSETDVSQHPQIRAVCLSSSYLDTNFANGMQVQDSYDWSIWQEASAAFPFFFGDYGATHRRKRTTTYVPGGWVATIVYPLNESWLVYRHHNSQDSDGWEEGAKNILGDERYPPPPDAWGGSLISRAANKDVEPSVRTWRAAKVNLHIHRQIGYAAERMGGDDGGE